MILDTNSNQSSGNPAGWHQNVLLMALMGNLFYWLSLPPAGEIVFGNFRLPLWPLAWLAPVFWVQLTRFEKLSGKHPYRQLYLAGFLFWLAELYWLTLPHWSAGIGGLFLSLYFAIYLPLFIGLVRVANRQLSISVVIAAPVVWTGLEFFRAYFLTGLNISALGHSQYRWLMLIQISDLAGAYAVSFVLVMVAACMSRMLPIRQTSSSLLIKGATAGLSSSAEQNHAKNTAGQASSGTQISEFLFFQQAARTYWPLLPMMMILTVTLAYGQLRLQATKTTPGAKIALIQGSIDTQFDLTEEEQAEVIRKNQGQYFGQSFATAKAAFEKGENLDLIVWPESMYMAPVIFITEKGKDPTLYQEYLKAYDELIELEKKYSSRLVQRGNALKCPLLVGCNIMEYSGPQPDFYVSSVFVDRIEKSGKTQSVISGRYDKIHLVMFGEYIPFGDWFPSLYKLTPLPGGTKPGKQAVSFMVGKDRSLRVAPHICFETFLPHTIRNQIVSLRAKNQDPDVLICQTNDGWFWGSSLLDLHLISTVFRAVECRKPILTAANTGLTSWIDGNGKIVECSRRRQPQVIIADVQRDERESLYLIIGDIPAGVCLLVSFFFAAVGAVNWYRQRRSLKT